MEYQVTENREKVLSDDRDQRREAGVHRGRPAMEEQIRSNWEWSE
jgi:hypothetical protein